MNHLEEAERASVLQSELTDEEILLSMLPKRVQRQYRVQTQPPVIEIIREAETIEELVAIVKEAQQLSPSGKTKKRWKKAAEARLRELGMARLAEGVR